MPMRPAPQSAGAGLASPAATPALASRQLQPRPPRPQRDSTPRRGTPRRRCVRGPGPGAPAPRPESPAPPPPAAPPGASPGGRSSPPLPARWERGSHAASGPDWRPVPTDPAPRACPWRALLPPLLPCPPAPPADLLLQWALPGTLVAAVAAARHKLDRPLVRVLQVRVGNDEGVVGSAAVGLAARGAAQAGAPPLPATRRRAPPLPAAGAARPAAPRTAFCVLPIQVALVRQVLLAELCRRCGSALAQVTRASTGTARQGVRPWRAPPWQCCATCAYLDRRGSTSPLGARATMEGPCSGCGTLGRTHRTAPCGLPGPVARTPRSAGTGTTPWRPRRHPPLQAATARNGDAEAVAHPARPCGASLCRTFCVLRYLASWHGHHARLWLLPPALSHITQRRRIDQLDELKLGAAARTDGLLRGERRCLRAEGASKRRGGAGKQVWHGPVPLGATCSAP